MEKFTSLSVFKSRWKIVRIDFKIPLDDLRKNTTLGMNAIYFGGTQCICDFFQKHMRYRETQRASSNIFKSIFHMFCWIIKWKSWNPSEKNLEKKWEILKIYSSDNWKTFEMVIRLRIIYFIYSLSYILFVILIYISYVIHIIEILTFFSLMYLLSLVLT